MCSCPPRQLRHRAASDGLPQLLCHGLLHGPLSLSPLPRVTSPSPRFFLMPRAPFKLGSYEMFERRKKGERGTRFLFFLYGSEGIWYLASLSGNRNAGILILSLFFFFFSFFFVCAKDTFNPVAVFYPEEHHHLLFLFNCALLSYDGLPVDVSWLVSHCFLDLIYLSYLGVFSAYGFIVYLNHVIYRGSCYVE